MHGDVLVRARWRLVQVNPSHVVGEWTNLDVLSNGHVPKGSLGDSDIPHLAPLGGEAVMIQSG